MECKEGNGGEEQGCPFIVEVGEGNLNGWRVRVEGRLCIYEKKVGWGVCRKIQKIG